MKKRIPEIILGSIVVLLLCALFWVQVASAPYKVRESKVYNFNAYKLTHTDDSITETLYYPDDNLPMKVSTMYLKDGKVTKIIEEYHYSTIDQAKKRYETELNNKVDTLTLKLDKNIFTHVINGPEFNYTVDFKSNKEVIDYMETHSDEFYQDCKRVY